MKLYKTLLTLALLGLSINAYSIDIKRIDASNYDKKNGHVPANLLDNNNSTRWAAAGKNNWLLIEFNHEEKIDNMVINAFKSKERFLSFSLSYSLDNKTWITIPGQFQTASVDDKLGEKFIFSKPITAKYLRLNTFGTNYNNWSAINELSFNSSAQLPTQTITL